MNRRIARRTRGWSALLLLVTSAAVVGATPSGAAPQSAAVSAATAPSSTVVGVASRRCFGVIGNSPVSGKGVNIYQCKGQANQHWTLTPAGELRVFDGTLCLDVKNRDTTSPASLQVYRCNGQANQKWTIGADGTIVGVQSRLCLTVAGAKTANNSIVDLYTCKNRSNQKWTHTLRSGDTEAPTAPTQPRVDDLTCDAATFSWSASSDDVAVAFYDVYHDGQHVKSVPATVRSTQLVVVGGVTWGLYVNARDAAGNVSQASDTVAITPPVCQVDTEPPTRPEDLTRSVQQTSVTLHWSASTDDVAVSGYDVYRDGAKVGRTSATEFIDSGLAPATTYSYHVVARDAQGNSSPASRAVRATTGASCGTVCGVVRIGTDTDIPWGLVTLPDGTILYARRDARDVVHLDPSSGTRTTLGVVPNVDGTNGEGGLMGLAIAPDYATTHWLYVMHTSPTDNRVVRIKVGDDGLEPSTTQVLLTGILRNKYHNGGRLRFGPDGTLYVATGDGQNPATAQDINSLNGKVLRMNPDGSIPPGNPFGNYVWSLGHRNPQGLAFDSSGRLWEQEFGNSVMDETNLITKGGNYGWPACEGTVGTCGTAGFIAPKRTYSTAEASCSGMAIVRDVLYLACARGARMYREVISGDSLTNVQSHFVGTYGRLRTVEPAPDGGLWLTTTRQGDKDSIANNSSEELLHVSLGE